MIKNSILSLLLLIVLSSCDNGAIFDKNISINNRNWTYDQKPTFTFHVKDNAVKYNIFINLRHSAEYDYSNLFILVHEKGPKLKDTVYRKEIKLAELDGQWIGKSAASLYEMSYLAKKDYSFPDTGIYTFTVEQNMRDNPLKNVVDVGIKVVKQ